MSEIVFDPKSIKLFVASPIKDGSVKGIYTKSWAWTSHVLRDVGIEHDLQMHAGPSSVEISRNLLVARFMTTGYTHLLFIDADLGWNPAAVLHLLAATRYEDMGIVGGVYPRRENPTVWPCNLRYGEDGRPIVHPGTGFVECRDLPTGFMMVRRDVFVKLMAAHPELKCQFRDDRSTPAAELPYEYALLDRVIDSDERRMYLTEDFAFCRRWQVLGGRVWMDPQINLDHNGYTAYMDLLLPRIQESPTRAEDIDGWMEPVELTWLRETAAKMESVAELGSWKGRATWALCESCPGPVYAVDHWQGSHYERFGPHIEAQLVDVYEQFDFNVGHFANLHVVKKPFHEAVSDVPDVDMVFIDGGHTYEEVRFDLRNWRGKAKRILAGHDFHMPGVQRAVTEELGEVEHPAGSIWVKRIDQAMERAA